MFRKKLSLMTERTTGAEDKNESDLIRLKISNWLWKCGNITHISTFAVTISHTFLHASIVNHEKNSNAANGKIKMLQKIWKNL